MEAAQDTRRESEQRVVDQHYGNDYIKWKNWGGGSFGAVRKSDSAYFSAEIRKTGCLFKEGAAVLEIGFGNGSFLGYAQQQRWDVRGTELNAELVEIARASGFNATHAEDLSPFADAAFELVVAFDVLEHMPQESLRGFILEVKRILRPGGYFIARFPNGDSPLGLPNQNGDVTHITTIGSGKARYFAAQCGMDITFLGGQAQPILGASALHSIHSLTTLPIRKAIDFIANAIFFPRANMTFSSSNMVMIYRKREWPDTLPGPRRL